VKWPRGTRRRGILRCPSALGKIEVVGPDAALHEPHVCQCLEQLAVGAAATALLLREDDFVFDDGVVARTAEDRFHVTTTTGGAPRVLAMMETICRPNGRRCGSG